MAYPTNVDSRIAAMEDQLDIDLATGLDSSVLEDLEKLTRLSSRRSSEADRARGFPSTS